MRCFPLLPAAVLTGALVLGCGNQPASTDVSLDLNASGAGGPLASGNVNFINPNGEHAQRAFEAYADPNGVVHGQYVQNTTGLDGAKRVNAGDIDCITLIGTNTALVSGSIRRHTIPELIGAGILFFVVDNGPGSSGTPDQVGSLFAFNPGEEDCTDLRFAGGDPISIESGNVLVKP